MLSQEEFEAAKKAKFFGPSWCSNWTLYHAWSAVAAVGEGKADG